MERSSWRPSPARDRVMMVRAAASPWRDLQCGSERSASRPQAISRRRCRAVPPSAEVSPVARCLSLDDLVLAAIGARARGFVIAILVVRGENDKPLILLWIRSRRSRAGCRGPALAPRPCARSFLAIDRGPAASGGPAKGGAKISMEEESPDVTRSAGRDRRADRRQARTARLAMDRFDVTQTRR